MKILVIGGGGREHALVWKLCHSRRVEKVWCAPGNGGIARQAECHAVDLNDVSALTALAERLKPDLTVAGPELPLVLGVADEFARRGLRLVGPSKLAAQLEGSKVFAKEFMKRHNIPTASPYGVYDSPGDAYSALCAVDWPVVVKADGLCAGKGVLVAPTPDDATSFIERLMEKREFGEAGAQVLLEETLAGQELSYIVLTDGEHILPLAPARDHKRVFDGDKGPNTGGMGAYSSDDLLPPGLEQTVLETIVRPTIRGSAAEGRPYQGFLYLGLMLTSQGPKVLEFNCRMGDPEAQAIFPRMEFDFGTCLLAASAGKLDTMEASWKPGASVCVVMASAGYPGPCNSGELIEGLEGIETLPSAVVFHAGTRREAAKYYSSSGRVLGVVGFGSNLESARRTAYDAVGKIYFKGAHYRTDIGLTGVSRTSVGRLSGG